MWMLPLYLHVNQKSDYDDDIMICHPNVGTNTNTDTAVTAITLPVLLYRQAKNASTLPQYLLFLVTLSHLLSTFHYLCVLLLIEFLTLLVLSSVLSPLNVSYHWPLEVSLLYMLLC